MDTLSDITMASADSSSDSPEECLSGKIIGDLPNSYTLISKLKVLLDPQRLGDVYDYRYLAEKLGKSATDINYLGGTVFLAQKSPTEVLVTQNNVTPLQLHFFFTEKREDVISVIETFLREECNCENHNSTR